jgi:transitional endoplasmic reticulum ATPase
MVSKDELEEYEQDYLKRLDGNNKKTEGVNEILMLFGTHITELDGFEIYDYDNYKKIVRIDRESMEITNVTSGDIVEVIGKRKTIARCLPLWSSDEGEDKIGINAMMNGNLGLEVNPFEKAVVSIQKLESDKIDYAKKVILAPLEELVRNSQSVEKYLPTALDQVPIIRGDNILIEYLDTDLAFQVLASTPISFNGNIITKKTIFHIAKPASDLV